MIQDENGKFTESNTEKAELLNKQYSSVFTKEDKNNMPNFKNRNIRKKFALSLNKNNLIKRLKDYTHR